MGGLLGFTPVPYQSGDQARDQGISRAGNARWRATSIQLAWGWVRWQPSRALTQWYRRRFGSRGAGATDWHCRPRAEIDDGALAVATAGVVPAGAALKVA